MTHALTITLTIPEDPTDNYVTTRYQTDSSADPRPQLRKAVRALQNEIKLMDSCPAHRAPSA